MDQQETTQEQKPAVSKRVAKKKPTTKKRPANVKIFQDKPEPKLSSTGVDVTSIVVTESNIRRILDAQPKVKVMIPSGHHEHEKRAVVVQLHGYCYRIQRDTEVELPESIVKILAEAKQTNITLKPREDGEGMQRIHTEGMRFPFQSRA